MFGQEFDSPHLHTRTKSILFKARLALGGTGFLFLIPFNLHQTGFWKSILFELGIKVVALFESVWEALRDFLTSEAFFNRRSFSVGGNEGDIGERQNIFRLKADKGNMKQHKATRSILRQDDATIK